MLTLQLLKCGVVCSDFRASGWAVIDCPETQVHGWHLQIAEDMQHVSAYHVSNTIRDEKHLVFECPALQDLRDKRPHVFQGAHADAMVLFMWQDDMIGMAPFIDEYVERILTHLIRNGMAGKYVTSLYLSERLYFRSLPQGFCPHGPVLASWKDEALKRQSEMFLSATSTYGWCKIILCVLCRL